MSLTFEIDEKVPMQSAACGTLNPLTVLGLFDFVKNSGCKNGIIQTVAASALGRMVCRLCQKEGIPLLNIVRR